MNPTLSSPRSAASNAACASSSDSRQLTVPANGHVSPPVAVQRGSSASAAFSFSTGLRTFQSRRRCSKSPGTPLPFSRRSATFGSALDITVRARINVPSSSSTPSPGLIPATGTPQAISAPASSAASAIAKLIIPSPPWT